MRLFLDENLSPQLTQLLKKLGHDTICANDVGLNGRDDEEIREYAIQQDRVLLTLDADFANIARYPVTGTPGVIWLKPDAHTTLAMIQEQMLNVLMRLKDTDLRGKLMIVSNGRIRSRMKI